MAGSPVETSAWIRRFHPGSAAPVRLVCFPHAGGSASYYFPVSKALSSVADVQVLQYPGRQDRRTTPFVEDMDELADAVTAVLRDQLDLPLVLFGHSMGATLAFEVAARLEREGVELSAMFARDAPRLVGREPAAGHRGADPADLGAPRPCDAGDGPAVPGPDSRRAPGAVPGVQPSAPPGGAGALPGGDDGLPQESLRGRAGRVRDQRGVYGIRESRSAAPLRGRRASAPSRRPGSPSPDRNCPCPGRGGGRGSTAWGR